MPNPPSPSKEPHAGCPFLGLTPEVVIAAQDRMILGNGAAKGLRLHLTLRDVIALVVMLVSLAGVWYSLASKVDRYGERMDAHLENDVLHPGVISRQMLIDERIALKQAEQNANFKRLEEQISDLKNDIKDLKAAVRGRP